MCKGAAGKSVISSSPPTPGGNVCSVTRGLVTRGGKERSAESGVSVTAAVGIEAEGQLLERLHSRGAWRPTGTAHLPPIFLSAPLLLPFSTYHRVDIIAGPGTTASEINFLGRPRAVGDSRFFRLCPRYNEFLDTRDAPPWPLSLGDHRGPALSYLKANYRDAKRLLPTGTAVCHHCPSSFVKYVHLGRL